MRESSSRFVYYKTTVHFFVRNTLISNTKLIFDSRNNNFWYYKELKEKQTLQMEVLLSKEHYCYQIHILHTSEKQCSPPSIIDNPSFLQKNLDAVPYKQEVHTINIYIYTGYQEFFAQSCLVKTNLVNLLVNLGLILI